MITGKNLLVTGGAGSVGRELVTRLLHEDPRVIRVLDNNEPSLSQLRSEVDDERCRYLAGDIRNKDRLERAMEDIDIVIHTAAMKHVDISEYNPFEAVQTNVVGLQNVVDAAIDSSVERLVFTSSDKAVNPANTMGATKLLGEKLVTAGNKYSGDQDLRLASVRFGNVLSSSQSVVPLFRDQIRSGGPITLTDRRMTRFFLTYDDVADLVTESINRTGGGEIFVSKMPAIRIEDLAEAMIETLAPRYGHKPSDIGIEIVGKRLGETYHEHIMTEREAQRAQESENLYAISPETSNSNGYLDYDGTEGFEPAEDITLSSANADKLDTDEIIDLLFESGAIERETTEVAR